VKKRKNPNLSARAPQGCTCGDTDPMCMAALRAGGHIWVREEVTNG